MAFFEKVISPGLSPNLEKEDVGLALKQIFSPSDIKIGGNIAKIESWFKYNFSSRFVFTFSAAREAEFAILAGLGIEKGDEVIIQAFTCAAVAYPILWLGATPIYADINEKTLSIDPKDLSKKITKNTKAIIVQHTFGIVGEIEEIQKIAKKNNIFLIEDCAHVIGGVYKEKKIGRLADAAFFSFGRDKSISSVFGGALITNKIKLAQNIKKIRDISPYPSVLWIYKQLFYILVSSIVLLGFKVYPFFGKAILYIFKKIHFISKPVISLHDDSIRQKFFAKRFPNGLGLLCVSQLGRINRFNKRRSEIYLQYKANLVKKIKLPDFDACYLRIPVLVDNRLKFLKYCKEYLIYLGDWYSNVIDPKDTNFSVIKYKKGSCKKAEKIATKIINLPCNPTMSDNDVQRVINVINKYYEKHKI